MEISCTRCKTNSVSVPDGIFLSPNFQATCRKCAGTPEEQHAQDETKWSRKRNADISRKQYIREYMREYRRKNPPTDFQRSQILARVRNYRSRNVNQFGIGEGATYDSAPIS